MNRMNIQFSRHARRRARLYKISLSAIEKAVQRLNLTDGRHEILTDDIKSGYLVKIVITVDGNTTTVVTNYPVKKGLRNESTL